jgi:hypothetical protein
VPSTQALAHAEVAESTVRSGGDFTVILELPPMCFCRDARLAGTS